MRLRETLGINEKGHLHIGNCDAVELAQRYGTPLYVMDEAYIRSICRSYMRLFTDGGEKGAVLFASKAFSNLAIYKIIASEGLGADVVSAGELYAAKKAGFPMERVYLHGSNKTPEELSMALEYGIRAIVVDSVDELKLLLEVCKEMNKKANILLRINPGIDAHTHEYIQTANEDSKFGMSMVNGGEEAIALALQSQWTSLLGFHCHVGSQIFETEPFEKAAQIMVSMMAQTKEKFGYEIKELDLGGGFGIHYSDGDDPMEPYMYVKKTLDAVRNACREAGIEMPYTVFEPGRSIVGEAGVTLYTVGVVKEIPGIRTYVSIDGGMTDNPRYILYQARYDAAIANKMNEERSQIVSIAGRCCESGDMIGKDMPLQKAERGDILAVFSTGAYNYSMASNYNRVPKAAAVLVHDGQSSIMTKRESYDELVRNDEIPAWLND